jgi:DHA1 family multidrug resistance protein-like MFS transporter
VTNTKPTPMAASANNDGALRNGAFFLLMAAVFSVSMGHGIILPILPAFLARLPLDAGRLSIAWHTGMLTGVYMFALFACAPLWGHISDRIGRRPVILIGLGGFILAGMVFALSQSLWLSYAARIVAGAGASAVLPVTLAYVGDMSGRETRARYFAWMSGVSILGFLAGPGLSGTLLEMYPALMEVIGLGDRLAAPFFIVAIFGGLIWTLSYFSLPEAVARSASGAAEDANLPEQAATPIAVLFVLTLLLLFGVSAFEVALALLGQQVLGFTPGQIGLLFMECSLAMMVVQILFFSMLTKQLESRRVVVSLFLAMSLGLVWLPRMSEFGALLFFVAVIASTAGMLTPLLAYQVSLGATAGRGAALGKQTAAASLGQALGSVAAGGLFALRPESPFWVAAALLLLGAIIYFTLGGRPARKFA